MAPPRFSVLVPTRDNPLALRHALASVLAQEGDDYEVVVADNFSAPETRRAVDALASPKVRYARSEGALSEAANRERGLQLCEGEYVTVLHDDAALLPSALQIARRVTAAMSCEILSWRPHRYAAGFLTLGLDPTAVSYPSRALLRAFYEGGADAGLLPEIDHAFVHRGVIDDAILRYDSFFVDAHAAPAVCSGILVLYITEACVHSNRGLSIHGRARTRQGLVAGAKLLCHERYFPTEPDLQVEAERVLRELAARLNDEPDAYAENLADLRALAARHGVRLAPADIAAPQAAAAGAPAPGPVPGTQSGMPQLVVDCGLAGAADIIHAARIAEGVLPPEKEFLAS